MNVLVTGATGYLGRAVVERLLADGVHVCALARSPHARLPQGIEIAVADLGSGGTAIEEAVHGADAVVHCGAHLGEGDRARFARINVAGTASLLGAAVRAGVQRFVHVSSVAVHGWARPGTVIGPEWGYDPHPELRDDYAWSKIEADRWVALFRERQLLDAVTLRPGIIYGGGRDFFARMYRALGGRLRLIFGTPRMRLPLVHVSDVVDAVARAIGPAAVGAGTMNVVGPDALTQAEYLSLRARLRRERVLPVYLTVPAALGRLAAHRARFSAPRRRALPYCFAWAAQETRYDPGPAAETLGWTPRTHVAEGLLA